MKSFLLVITSLAAAVVAQSVDEIPPISGYTAPTSSAAASAPLAASSAASSMMSSSISYPPSSISTMTSITSSPSTYPAGSTLSNGGYVCNPAHSYPTGQSCVSAGEGLYTLVYSSTASASGTGSMVYTGTTRPAVATYTGAASGKKVPAAGFMAIGLAWYLA